MRRVKTLGLGTVWALLLLATGSAALGQVPTAEQLELLNSLPPTQREAHDGPAHRHRYAATDSPER